MTERLFDWAARPCERVVTVASLRAGKGRPARHAQVTADTAGEAAAAASAGIEMVVCRAANVAAVRSGGPTLFITAALGFAEAVGAEDVLRAAIRALVDGADAVVCTRRPEVILLLASEGVPVVAHAGFIPRKSTWTGRVRAVGRSPDEAEALARRIRELEEAGAFAVEVELVPAPLLTAITASTRLVTISLGSGPGGDVVFLFTADICGDTDRLPRHARAWGDLAGLRRRMAEERLSALTAFRAEVGAGTYPARREIVDLPEPTAGEIVDRLKTVFPRW